MEESNAIRRWKSWVEKACTAPEDVSMNGTFEEVVAYLTGFFQGQIMEAKAVTSEAARWMAVYEEVLTRYGGVRERSFSAWPAFRRRFASDSEALAELARLFDATGDNGR